MRERVKSEDAVEVILTEKGVLIRKPMSVFVEVIFMFQLFLIN